MYKTLNFNDNYIFFDVNGNLRAEYESQLIEHGYNIRVLDLINPNNGNYFNPFVYLERDEYRISELCENITKHNKEEKLLLSSIITYIAHYCPQYQQTLVSVLKLLRAAADVDGRSRKSKLDVIFAEVRDKDCSSIALKQFVEFCMYPENIKRNAIASCCAKLSFLESKEIIEKFEFDTLNLIDMCNEEKNAIFVISPLNKDRHNIMLDIFSTVFVGRLVGECKVGLKCIQNEDEEKNDIEDGITYCENAKNFQTFDDSSIIEAKKENIAKIIELLNGKNGNISKELMGGKWIKTLMNINKPD